MKKPILSVETALGLLVILPLFLAHCRKASDDRGELDANVLIAGARTYVSKEILSSKIVIEPGNPRNDRTLRTRDILWSSAAVITFRGQPAIVAPLHFTQDIFLRTTWGGNNNFRLDNQERLLVFQDSGHVWHAQMVTTLPDTSFLQSDQSHFSGLILVEDWWGNPSTNIIFCRMEGWRDMSPVRTRT